MSSCGGVKCDAPLGKSENKDLCELCREVCSKTIQSHLPNIAKTPPKIYEVQTFLWQTHPKNFVQIHGWPVQCLLFLPNINQKPNQPWFILDQYVQKIWRNPIYWLSLWNTHKFLKALPRLSDTWGMSNTGSLSYVMKFVPIRCA